MAPFFRERAGVLSFSTTLNSRPASGTPFSPSTFTATDGPASFRRLPSSLISARTLPQYWPQIIMSPTRNVPLRTSTVAVGPPGLEAGLDDVALGVRLGLAFSSSKSAWSTIISSNLSTPCLVSAETSTKIVSPPQSSRTRPFLLELLADLHRVGVRMIALVDRHDDRDLRGLGVAQRFERLRHHAVVRRDDQHDDVGDVRAARAHGAERRVAGRIEEGDLLQFVLPLRMREGNGVGADVLGDAAGFARGDVGLANHIEQRRLAVVDVAHDRDDRRARLQVLRLVLDDPVRPSCAAREPCPPPRSRFLDLEAEAVLGANLLGDGFVDRLVDVGEHPGFHQVRDELKRFLP